MKSFLTLSKLFVPQSFWLSLLSLSLTWNNHKINYHNIFCIFLSYVSSYHAFKYLIGIHVIFTLLDMSILMNSYLYLKVNLSSTLFLLLAIISLSLHSMRYVTK